MWQSCAAKLSDTEFIILGGYHDRTQALIYNEEQNTWKRLPRLTVRVRGHSCVGLGDIVLMAGGYSDGDVTGRTVIFDTKTGSAREVASLKYPRAYATMELFGDRAVILGGIDGRTGRRTDAEIWNMDTETWEEADIHLNFGRAEFSLMATSEEINCE